MVQPELIDRLRVPPCYTCDFTAAGMTAAAMFAGGPASLDPAGGTAGGASGLGSVFSRIAQPVQRLLPGGGDIGSGPGGGDISGGGAGLVSIYRSDPQRHHRPCPAPPSPRRPRPPKKPRAPGPSASARSLLAPAPTPAPTKYKWRPKRRWAPGQNPSKDPLWVGQPYEGPLRHWQDQHADEARSLELSGAVRGLLRRYQAMGTDCPLFVRKFAPSTATRLGQLMQEYVFAAPEQLR